MIKQYRLVTIGNNELQVELDFQPLQRRKDKWYLIHHGRHEIVGVTHYRGKSLEVKDFIDNHIVFKKDDHTLRTEMIKEVKLV